MPTQANDVVLRMKNDSRIDYANDWKLISLFVGGNDLCASCDDWVSQYVVESVCSLISMYSSQHVGESVCTTTALASADFNLRLKLPCL